MDIDKQVKDPNIIDESSSKNEEPPLMPRKLPFEISNEAGPSRMDPGLHRIATVNNIVLPGMIRFSKITIDRSAPLPPPRNEEAIILANRFPVSTKNNCRTPAERVIAAFLPHMKPRYMNIFVPENRNILPQELAKIFDRIGAMEKAKDDEEFVGPSHPDDDTAPAMATLDVREIRDFYNYLQEEELNFKDDFYQDFQKTLEKEIEQADMASTSDESEILRKRKLEDALLGDKKRRLLSNFAGSTLLNLATMGRERSPVLSNSISFDVPDLSQWLLRFNSWSNTERLRAIDSLISGSGSEHVRHMLSVIEPFFQRDFITLLPRELALKILKNLEATDLLKAAQTCHAWKYLADDDLLWKEKCLKVGITEERPRTRSMPPGSSSWKATFMAQHIIGNSWIKNALSEGRLLECRKDHIITCLQFYGNKLLGKDEKTMRMWSDVTSRLCNCREILAERAKRRQRARVAMAASAERYRRLLLEAQALRPNRRARRGRRRPYY